MHQVLRKDDWFHPDGFPIAVERRDPQEPFGLHAHEFTELVIITGGRGLHVTGSQSWPLSAGDVFVISGSRPHNYRNMDQLRLVNILYDPTPLQMELRDLTKLAGYHALFRLEPAWRRRHQFNSRLRLTPRELGVLLGLVDQLDEELRVRAPGFAFMASALFMRMIGFLSRCYSRCQGADSRSLLRIAEAITHLEVHFADPIRLDDLAAIAQMSKRSFIRTFHAATGRSPIAYLIQLRTNRAAAMLRSGDEPVTEVAFRVGFRDSNYFARQFHNQFGVSPRHYRRQQVQPP